MWHRCISNQLICLPKKHVSSSVLKKIFCVSCKQLCYFGWSRRHISTRDDADKMKSSAHILWDYLRIDSPLKKSDLILVLGNSDLRTADYAAKLYLEGFAPKVAVSGKEGHGTKGKWGKPEAVVFAQQLVKNKVPSESILLELKATSTGENIRFTQRILQDCPDFPQLQSVILVQTPFMGRRTLATFMQQWEKAELVDVMVSSPPIPLEEYPDKAAGYSTLKDVALEMVRNMQRIQQYPSKGFQIPQSVPSHVLEAFRHLKSQLRIEDVEV